MPMLMVHCKRKANKTKNGLFLKNRTSAKLCLSLIDPHIGRVLSCVRQKLLNTRRFLRCRSNPVFFFVSFVQFMQKTKQIIATSNCTYSSSRFTIKVYPRKYNETFMYLYMPNNQKKHNLQLSNHHGIVKCKKIMSIKAPKIHIHNKTCSPHIPSI